MNPPQLTPWKRGDMFSAAHLNEMVDLQQAAEPLQVDSGDGDLEYVWGSNGRGISSRKRRRPIFIVRMQVVTVNPGSVTDVGNAALATPQPQYDVVEAQPYIISDTSKPRGAINDPHVYVKVYTNLHVGDEFYATTPIGGTDRIYSSNPVVWAQVTGNDIRQVLIGDPSGTAGSMGAGMTGSGYYLGKKQYGAAPGLDASTLNENLPDFLQWESTAGHDCIIENSAENDTLSAVRSHWVPPAQVYTFGVVVGHTNDDSPLEVIRVYVPPLECQCQITGTPNPYPVLIIDGFLGPTGSGGQTGIMTNLPELNGVGSTIPVGTKVMAKLINFSALGVPELESSAIYTPLGCGTSCGTLASNIQVLDQTRWLYFDDSYFVSNVEQAFDPLAPLNAYYVTWRGFPVSAQNYASLTATPPAAGTVLECDTQHIEFASAVNGTASAATGFTRAPVQWGIVQGTQANPCGACGNPENITRVFGYADFQNTTFSGQDCPDSGPTTGITTVKTGVGIKGGMAGGVITLDNTRTVGIPPIETAVNGSNACQWDIKLHYDTTALTVTSGNLTTIGLSDTESYITSITASGGTVTINASTITYYNGLRQSKTTSSSTLSC